jgi:hypothetical protein
MEGASDVELKTYRMKSKADIAEIMLKMPQGTDVATLDRSDGQSPITHTIWSSPNYVDLNDRLEARSPSLHPFTTLSCVGEAHVFTRPELAGRCRCGKWLIAVAETRQ